MRRGVVTWVIMCPKRPSVDYWNIDSILPGPSKSCMATHLRGIINESYALNFLYRGVRPQMPNALSCTKPQGSWWLSTFAKRCARSPRKLLPIVYFSSWLNIEFLWVLVGFELIMHFSKLRSHVVVAIRVYRTHKSRKHRIAFGMAFLGIFRPLLATTGY